VHSCLQGIGSLYWGFVPFLIESFPYDCTELGTYSQLHDWRTAALKKDDSTSRWVASVPDQVSSNTPAGLTQLHAQG
jgi:hypothetical protein